ncbi:MAG TPA: hypothetical protein DD421_06100 [Clostridiaceae bacterium]|jgi:O-antigen ligase|nr:hypothetical protein [Clostridiaceae bacterium]
MRIGIGLGGIGFILLRRKQIFLPPYKFLLIITTLCIYYSWRGKWHIETIATNAIYCLAILLFYNIFTTKKNRETLFAICTVIAILLCVCCIAQFVGWLPSYHNTLNITGPFDNPAGSSASLSLLLPFVLNRVNKGKERKKIIYIIISIAIIILIILSRARTATLAVMVITIIFTIHWIKQRTKIKISVIHYCIVVVIGVLVLSGLYYIKKDSADGRIFIWKCTGQLIVQKPIFGFGKNGFTANYMNEQALYFTKHPHSTYTMLADNIRHPFNEFLKNIVEYGLVGFFLMILLLLYPLYYSRDNNKDKLLTIRLSLLAMVICGLFSYPFNYPFIRLMIVMLISFVLIFSKERRVIMNKNYLIKGMVLLTSFAVLNITICQTIYEREWHTIAHKSLRGKTLQMLPRYKALYKHLQHNDLFLYNYAAELNIAGHYDESLLIADECDKLWADYDLQMLMADNYLQLHHYHETEQYLKKAAAMCPIRFTPLYKLVELYLTTGQKEKAQSLAQEILNKEEKVPSPFISSIKNKMIIYLNELASSENFLKKK